jgi:hypothetical protein
MPVASATNVLPSHGSDVAPSSLGPPLPVQPLPNAVAVAGHVVVSRANDAEAWPPAVWIWPRQLFPFWKQLPRR